MKVGILSDSHGKTPRLRKALMLLKSRGVQAVVHCGDLGGVRDLEELATAGVPVYVVLGNMDRHLQELVEAAQQLGVTLAPEVLEAPLDDGRVLLATHGHDESLLRELISEGRFPYLCHGHTPRRRDERIGPVRVINPGALYRGHPPSLAVLDTSSDQLEFVDLDPA